MAFPARLLLLALGVSLGACSELPVIPAATCGNGVVEAGEDCDSFGDVSTHCARPGEAAACRFQCGVEVAGGQRSVCPAGLACGTDSVCRAPSGLFAVASPPTEAVARRLEVGDFDGDGRDDAVIFGPVNNEGRASLRIAYFDEEARASAQYPVPGALGSPVLTRLDAEPTQDLAFLAGEGVSTLRGRTDRSLSPLAYPLLRLPAQISKVRSVIFDALPPDKQGNNAGDELVVVFEAADQAGKTNFLIRRTDDTGSETQDDAKYLLAVLPRKADLVAPPSAARLLWPKGERYCPSIVLAQRDDDLVYLVTPCASTPGGGTSWSVLGQEGVVSAVALRYYDEASQKLVPGKLSGAFAVFDINGDGHLDLLLNGTAPIAGVDFPLVYVAYGTGKGALTGAPGSKEFEGIAMPHVVPIGTFELDTSGGVPQSIPKITEASPAPFLAVTDFEGDGRPDFVLPDGILTSSDPLQLFPKTDAYTTVFVTATRWIEASAGDFNGDGRVDLVAAQNGPTFDVLLGAGDGTFSARHLPLDGRGGEFCVADFDGDLVSDVAFRVEGVHAESGGGSGSILGDSLQVFFGERGSPGGLLQVGRFERIVHLGAGSSQSINNADRTSELSVVIQAEDRSSYSLAQFDGSADRHLLAPLGLQAISLGNAQVTGRLGRPFALAEGRFFDPARRAVVALALEDDAKGFLGLGYSLWTLANLDDGRKSQAIPGDLLPTTALAFSYLGISVKMAAGDIDRDGRDEVLVVGRVDPPEYSQGNASGKLSPALKAGATSEVQVLRGAAGEPSALVAASQGGLPFPINTDSLLFLLDLDGDQAPELLVQSGTEEFVTTDTDAGPVVVDLVSKKGPTFVVWNDGKGSLDWGAPTRLPLPEGEAAEQVCLLQPTRGGLPRLAIASRAQLYVAQIEAPRQLRAVPAADERGRPIQGGEGLACGDFDGDGVRDVAIARTALLQIHRSLPELP